MESPAWGAVLPDLVSKDDLAAAATLTGIEFNLARAVGPSLAGVVIAVTSVGTAFIANAASFLGVIVVIARWKRTHHKRTTPPETVAGAAVAAIRYVRYSSAVRTLILRSGILMFFASGFLALLPSLAREVSRSAIGYGSLLGCFGFGAVVGMEQDSAAVNAGPIMVTIEYKVDQDRVPEFIKAIDRYSRIRRRDGAYRWGIFRDMENADRYLEVFLVDSWSEHLGQHERSTQADRAAEQRVQRHTRGKPVAHHLVYATGRDAESEADRRRKGEDKRHQDII